MGSLIWYKFQFMIELLIIEAMFVLKLRRRNNFAVRLVSCSSVILMVVAFFPLQYNATYGSIMFLFFFALTIVGIAICFQASFWNILFCSLAAYTVQHIAYLLYTVIINVFTSIDSNSIYHNNNVPTHDGFTLTIMFLVYFICYITVYAEAYLLLISVIPKNPDLQLGRTDMIVVSVLVIAVDIVFNMVTVYNVNADKLSIFLEQTYNLIICFLVLQMLFQKLRQKKILEEYDVIYQILQQERQQFKHLKDNMNIINVKVHDLKHQLRSVRYDEQLDPQKLKAIEKAFAIYQTVARTGNETLDIILTDKLFYCEQHEIDITCIADGKCISFMSEGDIYSLFGNALDNAIAAVEQLPVSQRGIRLSIKNLGDVVSIRVENKYKGKIRMEEGLPITTQKDTRYHGYGVLSMQMIAEKYNGKLNIDVNENNFVLDIVFFKGEHEEQDNS